MAVVATHQLSQCISAHAWNASLTMIAVCQNSNEVHIYKGTPAATSNWERVHVLQKVVAIPAGVFMRSSIRGADTLPNDQEEMSRNFLALRFSERTAETDQNHDQLVSGIDWAPISNYIVTCSHDRNSYVWSFDGSQWQPTLVILRLNRAATSVDWSPKENKFVVGSGAKSVCVCYYEPDNNWWVSKIIRKKHSSTVTGAAWHPNNLLIATTSTDGKCRVFCAYIKGVDSKINPGTTFADTKFGEQLLQLDVAVGWTFGVKWSPSGNSLAYVGHDSTVQIVTNVVGGSPSIQTVKLRQLPLRDVLFLSETRLVGGGFECNPILFEIDKNGVWIFVRFLDEAKAAVDIKSSTLFLEAMGRFHGQTKRGTNDAIEPSRANGYAHDNCITCIVPLVPPGKPTVEAFSTSGMDGRLVIWSFGNIQEILSRLEV